MKKSETDKKDLTNQSVNTELNKENTAEQAAVTDEKLANISGGIAWDLILRRLKKSRKD